MIEIRLKELRKEKKITQRELAHQLKIAPSTIAMYEIGQRQPDPETLQKLADFFNVSVDYLLGRTDVREVGTMDKSNVLIDEALKDDPELRDFWDKLSQREDLQLMFKMTKDLEPSDVKFIIDLIRRIHREEEENQ